MTIRSVIKGSGSALPRRAVANAEMAAMVDTTDEWIVERTGIRNRYIAAMAVFHRFQEDIFQRIPLVT